MDFTFENTRNIFQLASKLHPEFLPLDETPRNLLNRQGKYSLEVETKNS